MTDDFKCAFLLGLRVAERIHEIHLGPEATRKVAAQIPATLMQIAAGELVLLGDAEATAGEVVSGEPGSVEGKPRSAAERNVEERNLARVLMAQLYGPG